MPPLSDNLKTIFPLAAAAGIGLILLTKKTTGGKVFDVTTYGADKTGVTESINAFLACQADVKANGGGVFYMPAGHYLLNTAGGKYWRPSSNTEPKGDGQGATFLIRHPSSVSNEFILPEPDATGIHFHDLTIDPNHLYHQGNVSELNFGAAVIDSLIERVTILPHNAIGIGLRTAKRVTVKDCIVEGFWGFDKTKPNAFEMAIDFASAACEDIHVIGGHLFNNRMGSIFAGGKRMVIDSILSEANPNLGPIYSGGQVAVGDLGDGQIINSIIRNGGGPNTAGLELDCSISHDILVRNNQIYGHANGGILMYDVRPPGPLVNIILTQNICYNDGFAGIYIGPNTSGWQANLNTCYGSGYGIWVLPGPQSHYAITNNDLRGNSIQGLKNESTGSGTVFGNQE